MSTSSNSLDIPEAARYIGMSPSFLRQSRCYGNRPGRTPGPRYIKIGGYAVRYLRKDLDDWLEQQMVDPKVVTAEE